MNSLAPKINILDLLHREVIGAKSSHPHEFAKSSHPQSVSEYSSIVINNGTMFLISIAVSTPITQVLL